MAQSERRIGDALFTLESGSLAFQADGAVTVTAGDTQVLCAAVASASVREGIDFFPLTVEIEERAYAAGKIPGSFFRREGRPSEQATLAARLIDRPIRPSFPDWFRCETQIIATILGADQENPYEIAALIGSSAALMLSGAPFDGPIGAVRLVHIEGEWVANPTYTRSEDGTFELIVAGRRNDAGVVDILMVEAGAFSSALDKVAAGAPVVTEEVVAAGIEAARAFVAESIDLQEELIGQVEVPQREFPRTEDYPEELVGHVSGAAAEDIDKIVSTADKAERDALESASRKRVYEGLAEKYPQQEKAISAAYKSVLKKAMRKRVLEDGIRVDGRGVEDVRPLSISTGYVRKAHGSGLFQRGETQVLSITTLGMLRMEQMLDTISPETSKRYMHNYNFPPFSTGETGRVGGPRRREIGHGALAEKALKAVLPDADTFPYALRVVSEVLSSNGSTSMGSVCASSLSLMDAGVPIKEPVGGIAMGLISEGDRNVPLTDILGMEDFLGDMDFKVAGTREMVTALQLDTKIEGLHAEVLREALLQARRARVQILDAMAAVIAEPRTELNPNAPRIITTKVPVDKIGEVIGPKGKVIQEIQRECEVEIDVQDDGTIRIGSTTGENAEKARAWIEAIVNPPAAEVNKEYDGTVVGITKFGAFVNILPGRDGLVHISKLGGGKRIDRVEDVLAIGDKLQVLVEEIDDAGKVALRPLGEKFALPEGWTPPPPRERGPRRDGGDGRDRGRDRGPRDRDRGYGDRGGYGGAGGGGDRGSTYGGDRAGSGDRDRGGSYGDRGGSGDRDRAGSGDRDRAASGDRDRGGSGDRDRGGSGDRDRAGSGDRDRGGDRGGERRPDRDRAPAGDRQRASFEDSFESDNT